jgi:hypothetical protein
MGEFRVIDRRADDTVPTDHECCAGHCGGCCDGNEEPQDQADGCCGAGCSAVDVECAAFQPGTLVQSVLTGETVMVLKAQQEPGEPPTYIVRTKTYEAVMLCDFELDELEGA